MAEVQPYPPRAIAVDVNFSPKGPVYASEDDEAFFDFCNSIKTEKQIPVFLGVGETKSAPPEARLGNEIYANLAVAIAGNKSDTSRIPLWVKSSQSPTELKTLSYALALEYRKQLADAPKWISWALDTNVEATAHSTSHDEPIDDATLTYADRLVNYSKLDQMKLAALPSTSAEGVKQAASKYSNKLVILGDLNSDLVPVPGRTIDEPGSLVLASATYTLIKEPLFEFKWWVGLLLDLIIAAFIIVPVAIIRYRNPDDRVWVGKQALYVYVTVLVVLFVGWKLVSWAGVLWLDFLLVAFAVLLHPKVEHRVDHFLLARAAKRRTDRQKTEADPTEQPEADPKQTIGAIILILIAASSDLYGQQQTIPRCEKSVAAIGLQLNKSQRKQDKKKNLTCYLQEDRRSTPQSLMATSGKRQYRSGQHLSCDDGCSLWIQFCGTGTRYLVKEQQPKSFPVINAYRPPPPLDDPNPHNFGRISQSFSAPGTNAGSPGGPSRTAIGAGVGAIIGGIAGGGKGAAIGAPIGGGRSSQKPANRGSGSSDRAGNTSGAKIPIERAGNTSAKTTESQFIELLYKGNDALERGEYASAEQAYSEAKMLNPNDYRSFEGLGSVFASQQNWTKAEAAYREALKLNSGLMRLKLGLAVVLLKQIEASADKLQAQEVAQILRWANSISPTNQIVYDLFEQLFALEGTEPMEVERLFRRAVSYSPTSARANLRLARILFQLERPSEAKKLMRRAENFSFNQELLEAARIYEINGQV